MISPTPFNRDISRHIWETRYRAEGETDIQATWQRVAHAIAAAEKRSSALWTERFYGLLEHFRFLPGGRILDGQFSAVQQAVGTPRKNVAAAAWLAAVVEECKASGLVGSLIETHKAFGLSVAPKA